MIRPQFILDVHEELIVDNFAGGGGWSSAIESALGRHVDVAVNHNREALFMHEANHPQTLHLCEDVFHVDPRLVTKGRPVGLGVFSPDCTHFSKARGCKPVSKRIRGLAWVVLRWAGMTQMRTFMMENVEEWLTWGPLVRRRVDGKWVWTPDPKRAGQHVEAFRLCLTTGCPPGHPSMPEIREFLGKDFPYEKLHAGLGYQVEWRESRASSYGAPTIRKRFLMIGRRDGRSIVWPEPTHGNPALPSPAGKRLKPWRTAAECIDFTLACPSIFLTKEQARTAGCKRPLANASLARIAKGIDKEVLRKAKPFLVSLTHQGAARVESIEYPFNTITGALRGENALVTPFMSQAQQGGSNRGLDVPGPTTCASEKDQNQVVAASLARFAHGEVDKKGKKRRGKGFHSVEELLPTQAATNDTGLVAAGIAVQTTSHSGSSHNEPLKTICSGGHHTEFEAKLAATCVARTDMPKSNSGCVYPPDDPLRTPTTAGGFGEVEAKLAAPTMIQTGYGERDGQQPRVPGLNKPAGTAVSGQKLAPVEASLAAPLISKMRTGSVSSAADEGLHTVTAGGEQKRPGTGNAMADVEVKLAAAITAGVGGPAGSAKPRGCDQPANTPLPINHACVSEVKLAATAVTSYYGAKGEPDGRGIAPDGQLPTQGTENRFGAVEASLAASPVTVGVGGRAGQSRPRSVEDAAGTGTSKADAALVMPMVARQFKSGGCKSVDEPANSVMPCGNKGGGGKNQLVAAALAQNNTGAPARGCDAPGATTMGTGSHQSLITAALVKYYGNESELHGVDGPAHTVTVKDRMGVCQASIEIPLLTPEREAQARVVAAFLRSFGVEFEGEFATVGVKVVNPDNGDVWELRLVIYDIGMRMLQPRELYLAQGFPRDYIIDPVDPFTGKKLTKSAQVRMCGNSVSPPWGRAHILANVPELAVWSAEERRQRGEALLA